MSLLAAAVQLSSGPDAAANVARASALILRAGERGAGLVVLPENFALMSSSEEHKRAVAETLDMERPGPVLAAMSEAARKAKATVILGGMAEKAPAGASGAAKVHNSCVVLGPDGRILSVYRKIHLFDVRIPDGAVYEESKLVAPGERPLVADTPIGKVGLSVCYDLRFPELYRSLSAQGARILVVPAAFTLHTGRDHWHVLLRARAVENLCYVVAAAQYGRHDGNRQTFGHSLIADPWGVVLAEAADGEGLVMAELDFERQDRLRRELPSLDHRRL